MMSDGNVAILMNFERFTAVGDVREAWIMLSYAKPQPALYGTYTRSVAKWSANCRASLVSSGVGTLYTLNGQNVEAAGTIPATLAEEPTPNTVGEVVMNTICKFTPPNR
jgi:hypothetical protein